MGGLAAERIEDHHFEGAGKQIARGIVDHRLVHYRPRVNRYEIVLSRGIFR
jgi:hypothetical protein